MKRLWKALFYSKDGLQAAWADAGAFRLEVILAIILIPTAFALAQDGMSLALMVASVLLVLVVELLNTAIEAAIDRHGGEIHPMSKKAKDCGSAAVLVTLLLAAFVWAACLG